jgi:hypothetical protein
MYTSQGSEINSQSPKLIGEMLLEAGLISSAQLNMALIFQDELSQAKLGEIIASKGWLKKETIDFMINISSPSYQLEHTVGQPIGYYFQKAGLLTPEQIENIIQDQKKLGLKFCYLAVIKGFIRAETAEFFIQNVLDKVSVHALNSKSKINSQKERVEIDGNCSEDDDYYEEIIKTQSWLEDEKITDSQSEIDLTDDDDNLEIESSPMWIDQ